MTTDQIVEEKFKARRNLMYELLSELESGQITSIGDMKVALKARISASLALSSEKLNPNK